MDIDLALSADCPPHLTDKNTFDEKKDMKRYEKSNNMCMMTHLNALFPRILLWKDFFIDIERWFVKNEESQIGKFLTNLISIGMFLPLTLVCSKVNLSSTFGM